MSPSYFHSEVVVALPTYITFSLLLPDAVERGHALSLVDKYIEYRREVLALLMDYDAREVAELPAMCRMRARDLMNRQNFLCSMLRSYVSDVAQHIIQRCLESEEGVEYGREFMKHRLLSKLDQLCEQLVDEMWAEAELSVYDSREEVEKCYVNMHDVILPCVTQCIAHLEELVNQYPILPAYLLHQDSGTIDVKRNINYKQRSSIVNDFYNLYCERGRRISQEFSSSATIVIGYKALGTMAELLYYFMLGEDIVSLLSQER